MALIVANRDDQHVSQLIKTVAGVQAAIRIGPTLMSPDEPDVDRGAAFRKRCARSGGKVATIRQEEVADHGGVIGDSLDAARVHLRSVGHPPL